MQPISDKSAAIRGCIHDAVLEQACQRADERPPTSIVKRQILALWEIEIHEVSRIMLILWCPLVSAYIKKRANCVAVGGRLFCGWAYRSSMSSPPPFCWFTHFQ